MYFQMGDLYPQTTPDTFDRTQPEPREQAQYYTTGNGNKATPQPVNDKKSKKDIWTGILILVFVLVLLNAF